MAAAAYRLVEGYTTVAGGLVTGDRIAARRHMGSYRAVVGRRVVGRWAPAGRRVVGRGSAAGSAADHMYLLIQLSWLFVERNHKSPRTYLLSVIT